MRDCLLAIDQGTTSTRAIIFSQDGEPLHTAQVELQQHFPADGWVEHDAEEIWQATCRVIRDVLAEIQGGISRIISIGITNQRETTVVWERASGKPIHRAIVWQDRRTAAYCAELKAQGHEATVQAKTGLLLDPYFSATKLKWILDQVDGAHACATKGELAFGTVECFLLWKLTEGRSHMSDATNASRTLLFNIHTQKWDTDLLALFAIPEAMLPQVVDVAGDFGTTSLFGDSLPVTGMVGDQQAALLGQACVHPGMVKSTYGTGCFMIMNTGDKAIASQNRLLTTVAYRFDGKVTYGIEGSIFIAGAAIQWIRDGLKLIRSAAESERIAEATGDSRGVYLVPAFTGLGAPYWDPNARGALFGLTRDTGIGEVVTAGLQSVCYQTVDLLRAMQADGAGSIASLRVDGGMVVNNWVVQFLADMLRVPVERPQVTETTAWGAAVAAAVGAGVFSPDAVEKRWKLNRRFEPHMPAGQAETYYQGWLRAVERVKTAD